MADVCPPGDNVPPVVLELPASPMNTVASAASAKLGLMRHVTPISMNLLDLILADHNCVKALYDAYRLPTTTLDQKQLLAWEIIMVSAVISTSCSPVVRQWYWMIQCKALEQNVITWQSLHAMPESQDRDYRDVHNTCSDGVAN